ncbi:general transcription factor 3C polypeptide 1-like isoform X1 [Varroa jacobsoni]|uniref:general transcription factor 3C polypeptide 1-like isoform X1 n=1 Tax=Varroa jacobsoni TaxID=62625 RepID=UPI000BF6C94B|nr:general transcription factor 3C polypeptide 1-like isoform X1 [Varroa jacobsoni]XP_022700229.1 general transcription factor 3C polypeptide 1-like isoform X1 [Varroa jacobsoni]
MFRVHIRSVIISHNNNTRPSVTMVNLLTVLEDAIEEVALEGLDGSTLPTLWLRMEDRYRHSGEKCELDAQFKQFIWSKILFDNRLQLFRLPEDRRDVFIFDRHSPEYMDDCCHLTKANYNVHTHDVYPVEVLKIGRSVMGSCATFYTRTDVTDELREVEGMQNFEYAESIMGRNHVLVANQQTRSKTLCGSSCRLEEIPSMTDVMYCILERVGRSRYNGEITPGPSGLIKAFNETAGAIFYYKKKLGTSGVVVWQGIRISLPGKQQSGNLMHLRRFFRRIESPQDRAIHDAAQYLLQKPLHRELLSILRTELVNMQGYVFKKVIRGTHKELFEMKTITWKEYQPDASPTECQTKSQQVRMARVMQLNKAAYDAYVEQQEAGCSKEDDLDASRGDEDAHVDDLEGDTDLEGSQRALFSQISRIYDGSKAPYNYTILQSAYRAIEEAGASGLTMAQLAIRLAMPRLFIRNLVKSLTKEGSVSHHCIAIGRQQVTIYVSNVYADEITQGPRMPPLPRPATMLALPAPGDDKKQVGDSGLSHASPAKAAEGAANINDRFATQRTLARAVRIVELTRELKVIPHPPRLLRQLRREEQEAGMKDRLCRHSLDRILQKLDETGYINTVVCNLGTSKGSKELMMICAADVDGNHEQVRKCIEQWQLAESTKPTHVYKRRGPDLFTNQGGKVYPPINPAMAKKYGYKPKFRRAKIMYQFLHYMLYNYDGERVDKIDSNISDNPPQQPVRYQEDVSWKMFIPPLGGDRVPGWCVLGDAWLLCPLSLFVQLCSVVFEVPQIEEFLGHPVKQHYLLSNLPDEMRDLLLFNRRWLYQLHDQATTLSHMGLGKFGPQKHKEKDQIWFFLNRRITIVDTSGYTGFMRTNLEETDFVTESYDLQTEEDIFAFWARIEDISLRTSLGMYSKLAAKTYVTYFAGMKPELIQAARKYDFDYEDVGSLPPGDHQGACGFDSGLFAHRRSNWSGVRHGPSKIKENMETVTSQLKVIEQQFRKITKKRTDMMMNLSTNNSAVAVIPRVMPVPKKKPVARKREFIIRNKRVYKRDGRRAVDLDLKDVEALKNMKNLRRVRWRAEHDYILLLVKTLSSVVYPEHGRLVIPASKVRDLLQTMFPDTCSDKTKFAALRRANLLQRYPEKMAASRAMRFNIISEPQIMQLVEKMQETSKAELKHQYFLEAVEIARNLLSREGIKCSPQLNLEKSEDLEVDELEESLATFRYREPLNSVDVHQVTVATVLIASFALDGKTNWSYLLYTIYERYPDPLIRFVFKGLCNSQMIARKKTKNYKAKTVLHLPALPYSLSCKWHHLVKLRYNDEVVNIMAQQMQIVRHVREMSTSDANPTPAVMMLFANMVLGGQADAYFDLAKGSPIEFVRKTASGKANPKTMPSSSRLAAIHESMMDPSDDVRYDESIRLHPLPLQAKLKDSADLSFGCYAHKIKGGEMLKNDQHSEAIRRLKAYYDPPASTEEAETTIQKEFASKKHQQSDGAFASASYRLVVASKEVGLSLQQLWIIQGGRISYLEAILATLCNIKVLLQVGVNQKRFVAFQHSSPWLIKSYRMSKEMRKRVTDAMDDVMERPRKRSRPNHSSECAEVTSVADECARTANSQETMSHHVDQPMTAGNIERDNNEQALNQPNTSQQSASAAVRETKHRQRRRKMKCLSAQLENCKPLLFIPRMWKRPDGTLNVPIFAKMLLAVFSFVVENPGSTEEAVQTKFRAVMEPSVHVLDLLDILVRLECIKRFFLGMPPPGPVTLFSAPVISSGVTEDSESPDDIVFYETTEDGALRLNAFFSTSLQQRSDLPGY